MFSESSYSNLRCNSTARKLINALSNRPDELLRYLNQESSIFSKTADPTILTALRILSAFYDRVKVEVATASESYASESKVFQFVQSADEETCQDLVARYAKELSLKNRKRSDLNFKKSKFRAPATIPRSSKHHLNESISSDESSLTTSKSHGSSKNRSKELAEICSSLSSSSIADKKHASKLSNSRLSSRSSALAPARNQVNRSCSPIQLPARDVVEEPPKEPLLQRRLSNVEQKLTTQVSMGIQTDAIKVDAGTRTHFNNTSLTSSTPNFTDKTSTSKTSSSIVSSERSLGQVSIQRAAFLTSRSNFRVVTVRRDGSIQPAYGMHTPLDHSTPIRSTMIRDFVSKDLNDDEEHLIDRNSVYFQQVVCSSSESPLVAQEKSIYSSTSGTRVSEMAEDLPARETVSEEDVSTLNQVSPLPTG